MSGPTYKPREAYRTRRSAEESDADGPADDFAATALDRPAADVSDLRRAALIQRVQQDRRELESSARARRALIVALAITVAVALVLGVAFGAYLALS